MTFKTTLGTDVVFKFEDDAEKDKGSFVGYATKFNSVDLVGDTIAPGAFTKALENIGILPIFFNHDSQSVPIGMYTRVEQNARGLKVEGKLLLDIPLAKEVYSAMKAGVVKGLSIGIDLARDGYEEKEDGSGLLIKEVSRLREISICTFPCEPKAQIGAVKMETIRDCEKALRDAGFSRSQALTLISKIKAASDEPQSDSESSAIAGELTRLLDSI